MNINLFTSKRNYFFILLVVILIYINNFVFYNFFLLFLCILNIFFSFLCFYLFKLTYLGRKIFLYFIKSKIEISKIYWPSKYEVIKTVLIVTFLSVLISIIVWILDNFLLYIISIILNLRFI